MYKILLLMLVGFFPLSLHAAPEDSNPLGFAFPPAAAQPSAETLFEMVVNDLDGQTFALSGLKGKPLLINFWGTWCGPCRKEVPDLVELHAKYQPQGIVFVGLAVDEADKARGFAKEKGMAYQVLVGPEQAIRVMKKMGNHNALLPYTVAIDARGRIVSVKRGLTSRAELDQVLQSLAEPSLVE